MVTKNFLLVCRARDCGSVYLSGSVYTSDDLQHHIVHLDSIDVDVIDVIPVDLDLSKYQEPVKVAFSNNEH